MNVVFFNLRDSLASQFSLLTFQNTVSFIFIGRLNRSLLDKGLAQKKPGPTGRTRDGEGIFE